MILVTGAGGTVGREVVAVLAGCGVRVRALVRDRGRAGLPAGVPAGRVEVVVGDYGDRGALGAALEGVSRAFLVTNCLTRDDDGVFLAAARAAGVRRVVKLSAASVADAGAVDAITRWQRGAEEAVRRSGVGFTLLRPRAFMSNTLAWAPEVRAGGTVGVVAGSGCNACVDPRDVAEVAALVLLGQGHEGRVYTLTGPRPVTAAGQLAELGRQLGRDLVWEELAPAAARERLARRHPGPVVEALLQSAARQGRQAKAGVEADVPRLLGRPARSYRAWAAAHLDAFRPA